MSSVKDLDFTVSREGLCTRTECYQRLTLRKTTLYILMDTSDKREVEYGRSIKDRPDWQEALDRKTEECVRMHLALSEHKWLCTDDQGVMQNGRIEIDFKCSGTFEIVRRKRVYCEKDGMSKSNSGFIRKVIA